MFLDIENDYNKKIVELQRTNENLSNRLFSETYFLNKQIEALKESSQAEIEFLTNHIVNYRAMV